MNDPLTIICGDALSALQTMPAESVQCVVTSPPYWSLRDYGINPLVWDGDPECDHLMQDEVPRAGEAYGGKTKWQHVAADAQAAGVPVREQAPDAWEKLTVYRDSPIRDGGEGVGFDNAETTKGQRWKTSAICQRCGAWRGCLGLEPTPELYVQHIVQIFREVQRVLRPDGTLWLNLGDSYAGSWGNFGGQNRGNGTQRKIITGSKAPQKSYDDLTKWKPPTANNLNGMKPKDLVGIPWMVAFALRADGWWLRADIIWAKPNPMPESVTDRPTRSHEYVFLMTKSAKYHYDAEAIKEPIAASSVQRINQPNFENQTGGEKDYAKTDVNTNRSARKALENFAHKQDGHGRRHAGFNGRWDEAEAQGKSTVKRNRRSVWSIATAPFPEAHFATFPTALVTPCILAGCPPRGTVLDPFGGSGTVGKVALELGRRAILIEPKPEYVEMIKRRCQTTLGLAFTPET